MAGITVYQRPFALVSPEASGLEASGGPRVWPFSTYTSVFDGETLESPGHCAFWYEDRRLPRSLQQRWGKNARATVNRLQASGHRSCKAFTPAEAPTARYALCSRCFHGNDTRREIPLVGDLRGFHGVEKDADGSVVRWTKGDGEVPFELAASEVGATCSVFAPTVGALPYELWVDGTRLGAGPRQGLPRLEPNETHVLEIRSPVFIPARSGGSGDERTLGVRVKEVVLECTDEASDDAGSDDDSGVIDVISATYGSSCGARPGNYTQSVVDECNGRIDCQYPPAERRGDPFPGCAKDFSAEFRCGRAAPVRRADHPPTLEGGYAVLLSCD